jgi:hypothetical protein
MGQFLDDFLITGHESIVFAVNSDIYPNILLASNTGTVAVAASIFSGSVYTNPQFIINTGSSGNPGLMLLNTSSPAVEVVMITNVGDSLFGNASNHDLSLITNNTEIVKITAGGNVGIAHLTPPARLTVLGAGSTSATSSFMVANSSSTNLFTILNDGSIGVNIATPGARFDVNGNGLSTYEYVISVEDNAGGNIFKADNSGVITFGKLIYGTSPIQFNQGYISINGYTNNDVSLLGIVAQASGNSIHVRDSTQVNTQFIINYQGLIGIGTSTPFTTLQNSGQTIFGTTTGSGVGGFWAVNIGLPSSDGIGFYVNGAQIDNGTNAGSKLLGYIVGGTNAMTYYLQYSDGVSPSANRLSFTSAAGGNRIAAFTDTGGDAMLLDSATADLYLYGNVIINSFIGTGNRTVEVDSTGKLIVGIDAGSITAKAVVSFTPGSVSVANTITHGLGTGDVMVQLVDLSTGNVILANIGNFTTTTVDITFSVNPAGDVKAIVIG